MVVARVFAARAHRPVRTHLMNKSILLGFILLTGALPAAVVIQTDSFTTSGAFSGAGNHNVIPDGLFDATFQPFDSSLGALESFTIAWTLNVTWDFTLGEGDNHSVGGTAYAYFNGVIYDAAGGGSGYSLPGTGTRSFNANKSRTYDLASISGTTALDLLSIVTGDEPFHATYTDTIVGEFTGNPFIDLTATAGVTLTYSYAPSAIPEPSTYAALAGLMALGVALVRRRVKNPAAGA